MSIKVNNGYNGLRAACLLLFHRTISLTRVARIRQLAVQIKKNQCFGMVEAAQKLGFEPKG